MATLAQDSSSDSDSASDVHYDSFDEYPTEAANEKMTVVPYNSGDKQIQEEEKKKIEARVKKAKEAYRAGYNRRRRRRRRRRAAAEEDDDAAAEEDDDAAAEEDDDAETEIDDDVDMAVVSLKY